MKRLFSAAIAVALAAAIALPARADRHGAKREDAATITAEIIAIDHESRDVLMRGENGTYLDMIAGPEVRNLDQVEVGDILTITYFESVAAHIADANSSDTPGTSANLARAAEGEKPGMFAAEVKNLVVEMVNYDEDSHIATYILPNGSPGSIVVNPKMREFAASLKKGDKVDVTITRALAISMEAASQ